MKDLTPKALVETLKLFYGIFKHTIEGERDAQKMYKDAIALCEDAEPIRTLEAFYKNELGISKDLWLNTTDTERAAGYRKSGSLIRMSPEIYKIAGSIQ